MIKSFLIALVSVLVLFAPQPATAATGWKPLRAESGTALHWRSCTVRYAIDTNGYPKSRLKALNAAIRATERASGVDFVRVGWYTADVKITMSRKNSKKFVGTTTYTYVNYKIVHADVIAYSKLFRYPYQSQFDTWRHEFGHVLGLDHVKGSDIMNKRLLRHHTSSGWRSGLRSLYRSC